jgi:hypothetical protein
MIYTLLLGLVALRNQPCPTASVGCGAKSRGFEGVKKQKKRFGAKPQKSPKLQSFPCLDTIGTQAGMKNSDKH